MKKSVLITIIITASSPALPHDEIYKCVTNGKTTFSQAPCDSNRTPYQTKTVTTSNLESTSQTPQTPKGDKNALVWFEPDTGMQKCTFYQDSSRAQNEYRQSINLIEKLSPLVQSAEKKKQLDALRDIKLVDSCPPGATHKCYQNLFIASSDDSEFSRKFVAESKQKADYELYYSKNDKNAKSLEKQCFGTLEAMR